jgi:hypothetical protein
VNTRSVAQDPHRCGDWIMPYDTLKNMKRINSSLSENLKILGLEIEFRESASPLCQKARDYDFHSLMSSRTSRDKTRFNSRIGLDLIFQTCRNAMLCDLGLFCPICE